MLSALTWPSETCFVGSSNWNPLQPTTTRNKPATKIDMKALVQQVNDYPEAYLHERAKVFGVSLEAIHDQGCIVEFLPSYSPDLNLIEHKWAQAKPIRKQHRCPSDELFSTHMKYANL